MWWLSGPAERVALVEEQLALAVPAIETAAMARVTPMAAVVVVAVHLLLFITAEH
jgi:hypothetical protein